MRCIIAGTQHVVNRWIVYCSLPLWCLLFAISYVSMLLNMPQVLLERFPAYNKSSIRFAQHSMRLATVASRTARIHIRVGHNLMVFASSDPTQGTMCCDVCEYSDTSTGTQIHQRLPMEPPIRPEPARFLI